MQEVLGVSAPLGALFSPNLSRILASFCCSVAKDALPRARQLQTMATPNQLL
jgi:hypothetical protein